MEKMIHAVKYPLVVGTTVLTAVLIDAKFCVANAIYTIIVHGHTYMAKYVNIILSKYHTRWQQIQSRWLNFCKKFSIKPSFILTSFINHASITTHIPDVISVQLTTVS